MTSLEHNQKFCSDFMVKNKVFSRYSRVSEQVPTILLDTSPLPKNAYNPSILRNWQTKEMFLTYRYHFADDFRTKLGIATIGSAGSIRSVQDLDLGAGEHSVEDARLFSLHSEPWMSWVEADISERMHPKAIVKYGQIEPGFKVNRVYQPAQSSGNDWREMQKNWCFFESDENLFCIMISWPEQIIFQIQGEKVINEYKTKGITWPYGNIRGGNIVPHKGKLLRFFHSATNRGIGRPEHRYFVGCCVMNSRPPFETVKICSKPIIYGSEVDQLKSADRKACFHFKPNVAFPCGAINDGDNFVLSTGINDMACSIVRLTENHLNLTL